jgi:PHD/YefM family antitoxin component YafN of YafNO toxin-antitoxin module
MVIEINPEFLSKNGKPEFVVLSIEEFEKIKAVIEDYEDLQDLREAKAQRKSDGTIPLESIRKECNL